MSAGMQRVLLSVVIALAPLTSHAYKVNRTRTGAEIKWAVRSVPQWINTRGAPAGAGTAIRMAMQAWSVVPGTTFQFTYSGTTNLGRGRDGKNVTSFTYLGNDGALAKNWRINNCQGRVFESDIVYNSRR